MDGLSDGWTYCVVQRHCASAFVRPLVLPMVFQSDSLLLLALVAIPIKRDNGSSPYENNFTYPPPNPRFPSLYLILIGIISITAFFFYFFSRNTAYPTPLSHFDDLTLWLTFSVLSPYICVLNPCWHSLSLSHAFS